MLWAASHHAAAFGFTACSGATTTDVTGLQLGPLDRDTTLVSITVGANDVRFADVMEICTLATDGVCLDQVARSVADMRDSLPARLDATYKAVRAKAPRARAVVLGYPHLFAAGNCFLGMTAAKRAALNAAVDKMNDTIKPVALRHGFVFGDVRAAFTGHEVCSADPWLTSPLPLSLEVPYHPDADGQRLGYLPVLTVAARTFERPELMPAA